MEGVFWETFYCRIIDWQKLLWKYSLNKLLVWNSHRVNPNRCGYIHPVTMRGCEDPR